LSDYKEGEIWVVGFQNRPNFVCEITFYNFSDDITTVKRLEKNEYNDIYYLTIKEFKIFLGKDENEAREKQSMYFV